MIHNSIANNSGNSNNEKKDYFENEIEKKRKSQEKNSCGNVELETHKATKKMLSRAKANDGKKHTTSYQMNGVK